MRHFAANYIFDGEKLIKNAFISLDKNGIIKYISEENQALKEKPFMSFYNGILSPGFIPLTSTKLSFSVAVIMLSSVV